MKATKDNLRDYMLDMYTSVGCMPPVWSLCETFETSPTWVARIFREVCREVDYEPTPDELLPPELKLFFDTWLEHPEKPHKEVGEILGYHEFKTRNMRNMLIKRGLITSDAKNQILKTDKIYEREHRDDRPVYVLVRSGEHKGRGGMLIKIYENKFKIRVYLDEGKTVLVNFFDEELEWCDSLEEKKKTLVLYKTRKAPPWGWNYKEC